jgi:hypothetical protein
MGRLRGCGFSGGEISLLVGGRWSDSAVRKYASWDGVVDSSGKDRLMELLADIAEDFDDGDLEAFRVAREALAPTRLDFKAAGMLGVNLGKIKGSVSDVDSLSTDMAESWTTVLELKTGIETRKELAKAGLTEELQMKILEASRVYKDTVKFMDRVLKFQEISELTEAKLSLQKENGSLDESIAEKKKDLAVLERGIEDIKEFFEAHKWLKFAGFDLEHEMMLFMVAKKYDGPDEVLEAMKRCGSLLGIEKEFESTQARLEAVKKEYGEQGLLLLGLKKSVAEMEVEYRRSEHLRNLVAITMSLRSVYMPLSTLADNLTPVLEGAKKIIEGDPELVLSSRLLVDNHIGPLIGELRRISAADKREKI